MCLEGSVNIKLQKAAHFPVHAQVMPGVKAQLEPLVFCDASHNVSLGFFFSARRVKTFCYCF